MVVMSSFKHEILGNTLKLCKSVLILLGLTATVLISIIIFTGIYVLWITITQLAYYFSTVNKSQG